VLLLLLDRDRFLFPPEHVLSLLLDCQLFSRSFASGALPGCLFGPRHSVCRHTICFATLLSVTHTKGEERERDRPAMSEKRERAAERREDKNERGQTSSRLSFCVSLLRLFIFVKLFLSLSLSV
jgi:hypothetical protein